LQNLNIPVKKLSDYFIEADSEELVIHSIQTDTRKDLQGSWFIALKGENHNGHDYIETAIRSGAQGIILSEGIAPQSIPSIYVFDTTEFLGHLASYWRDTLQPFVIGVTGSNGKTSTKDFIAHLFRSLYGEESVLATAGNLNNHFGVPFTLLNLTPTHRIAIIEMGMNHPGEIERLSHIAKPDISIITSIAEGHIGHMGGLDAIAREKASIAAGTTGKRIILHPELEQFPALLATLQKYSATVIHPVPVSYQKNDSTGQIDFTYRNCSASFPIPGEHQWKNFLLAVTAFSQSLPALTEQELCRAFSRISELHSPKGRMNRLVSGSLILWDDTYNANPASFLAALQTAGGNETAGVFGEMRELGEQSVSLHRQLAVDSARHLAKLVFVTDKEELASAIREGWADGRGLSENLLVTFQKDCAAVRGFVVSGSGIRQILFKGSRGAKMEEWISCFQEI